MLMRAAPILFVVLWSSGFIAAKLGTGEAEPFTFLVMRFVAVIVLLWLLARLTGAAELSWRERREAALVGVGVHGVYLGGVFWAVRNGMPAGVVALVVSLQPILTAVVAAPLLGERISARHWVGLGLGLLGSALLIAPKIEMAASAGGSGSNAATLASAVLALLGITLGTIHQKRSAGGIDLIGGAIWQYAGALAVCGPLALVLETGKVNASPAFLMALAWLVVVLSIGAITLLMLLIRSSAVSRVSSLFYLVPATTAAFAYLMFDERLLPIQIAGMAVVMTAVALIGYPTRQPGMDEGPRAQ
mgnify:CR=1 FL=1